MRTDDTTPRPSCGPKWVIRRQVEGGTSMPIYMKYGNIQGTGKGNHKGWIELQSAQLGTHRNVKDPTGSGSNREASVPAVSEVVVTKLQDISSTDLFRQALNGQGVKVVIDFVAKD